MGNYIVTGGEGFIGSHLVESLSRDYHNVIVIDDLSSGKSENLLRAEHRFLKQDLSKCNVLKLADDVKILLNGAKLDGVFHLAAQARIQPSVKEPLPSIESNVFGTTNVLELMKILGCDRIVYSSSSSIYGKNVSGAMNEYHDSDDCQTPYSVSKFIGEKLIQTWGKLYGIRNVSLRYFNVYGPRSPLIGGYSPVIGKFFEQIFKNELMTVVSPGTQTRDFTYIDDVIVATRKAMYAIDDQEFKSQVLNIGTGHRYDIISVASMIYERATGLSADGSKGFYKLVDSRIAEANSTLADNSAAKAVLEWKANIPLKEGIDRCYTYYKKIFTEK
jgi:nucleoside-diphosphate-sugar epimerase